MRFIRDILLPITFSLIAPLAVFGYSPKININYLKRLPNSNPVIRTSNEFWENPEGNTYLKNYFDVCYEKNSFRLCRGFNTCPKNIHKDSPQKIGTQFRFELKF